MTASLQEIGLGRRPDDFAELLKEKGFDIKKQHMDRESKFMTVLQDTHSGSGCGCSSDAFRHDPSENRKRRLEADSFCSDRSTALYGQL